VSCHCGVIHTSLPHCPPLHTTASRIVHRRSRTSESACATYVPPSHTLPSALVSRHRCCGCCCAFDLIDFFLFFSLTRRTPTPTHHTACEASSQSLRRRSRRSGRRERHATVATSSRPSHTHRRCRTYVVSLLHATSVRPRSRPPTPRKPTVTLLSAALSLICATDAVRMAVAPAVALRPAAFRSASRCGR
jgi:hypothetical protein